MNKVAVKYKTKTTLKRRNFDIKLSYKTDTQERTHFKKRKVLQGAYLSCRSYIISVFAQKMYNYIMNANTYQYISLNCNKI